MDVLHTPLTTTPVKWLWIDCLCIIQDSKEDWLREAKMMARNYRQALFNISADAIEAGTSGLFQPRRAVDYLPLSFTATALDQTIRLTPSSANQFAWVYGAPTFSRAWVHRERQLSRRVLHFTDQQMIWECCATAGHGFASEMVPGEPLTTRPFGADNKQHVHGLQITEQGGIGRDESELHDSSLEMDNAAESALEDRLPEKAKAELLHCSYVVVDVHVLSNYFRCSRKLGGSVIVYDIAEFRNADLRYKNKNDAFGPLLRGALTLRGYLRSLRFTFDLPSHGEQPDSCSLSVLDNNRWQTVGPGWDKRTGDLFELKLDKAHLRQLDCSCFFVSTKFWGSFESCWQEISALLVMRNEQGEWQRIGMITFKDFYSLQVRYAMNKSSPNEIRRRLWLVKHEQLKKHQTTFWEKHKDVVDNERMKEEQGEEPEAEVWIQEPDPADLYAFDSGLDTKHLHALEPQTIVLT
ncbi:hypothetical protein LTR86_006618 [Recurvomyces mirabilis]|nr:hypothetical protein LTR86_006618 [Recurvomyces mirabilis]